MHEWETKPQMREGPLRNRSVPKTFAEVEKTYHKNYLAFLPFHGSERQQAVQEFQEGMHEWGLAAIWDACEIKNASNCVESHHGVPGLRLACFGFQSEPSPKDLAGILNANALYSATTGVVQIAFGFILVSQHGVSTNVLIPLIISGVSIVLSAFNVFLDFAGKLKTLETEKRISDKIQWTNKKMLADKCDKLKADRDSKLDAIDRAYDRNYTSEEDALLQKNREKKAVNEAFALDWRTLNEAVSDLLQLELTEYRDSLVRERAILSGRKAAPVDEETAESAFAVAQRRHQQVARKKAEIEQLAEKELDELSIDEMDFAERSRKIVEKRDRNLKALEMLQSMNSNGVEQSSIEAGRSAAAAPGPAKMGIVDDDVALLKCSDGEIYQSEPNHTDPTG